MPWEPDFNMGTFSLQEEWQLPKSEKTFVQLFSHLLNHLIRCAYQNTEREGHSLWDKS